MNRKGLNTSSYFLILNLFCALLIDENNSYEYSGKKIINNQRCERRENRLWISIKGTGDEIELISADREKEYRWRRVDDRSEAPDPSSAPDFDEFMEDQ